MTDYDQNTKVNRTECITEYTTQSAIGIKCVITTEEAYALQQTLYMAESVYAENSSVWNDDMKTHQKHIIEQLQLVVDKLSGAFLGSYFKNE